MENKFPKSQISGVQSIIPTTPTNHRKVLPISTGDPSGAGIFSRSLNIVLYYNHSAGDGDSGWLVAGWIKESLGRALTEQPLLCGRIRKRRTESEGENEGLEVVANDSGARLVEAKIPATLPEFLDLVKREKAKAEAETLFWRDIDEEDPQFSPLFYVQVTNFECGGYSIGISCSIVLSDLLIGTDFIRKWSEIQISLLKHKIINNEPTIITPIFYLPSLKQNLNLLNRQSTSISTHNHSKPVIIYDILTSKSIEKSENFTLKYIKKALGTQFGSTTPLDVFLFVKDEKIEVLSSYGMVKDDRIGDYDCDCDFEMRLEESRMMNEVSFWGGKRPKHISCNFGSISDGNFVIIIPYACGEGKSITKAIVALPP